MTLTFITPILLAFVALLMIASARRGYKKGATKSALRFATLIVSAFVGVGLAMLMAGLFKAPILSLLDDLGVAIAVEDSIGSFAVIYEPVVKMLSTLVFFLPSVLIVYIIVSIIISIVFASKAKKLKKDADYDSEDSDYYTKNSKSIGALLGAASGFFLAVVILSPVTGIFKCANQTVDIAKEFIMVDDEEEDFVTDELEDVLELSDDFMLTSIDALGGRMWFNLSTSTRCCGKWTSLYKEIVFFSDASIDEITAIMEKISNLDNKSLKAFDSLVEKTADSPILKLMLTSAVNDMSLAWLRGTCFEGIARPNVGSGYINDFFDELLRILSESDTKTVEEDLSTFIKLCTIVKEYDYVFNSSSYKDAADAFADGKLIEKLKREIGKNPRMESLEAMIDNLLMSTVSTEINKLAAADPAKQEKLYEDLSQMINTSVTVSGVKRVKALSTDIYTALKDYGIYAPEDMVEDVASMIISSLSKNGEAVTKEQVRAYFNNYQR